ncbi:transcriptional regulator [Virgibacillus phasianinus]|uniref:Transcriptional regulator n=1 Tax=Virgibacillus phasianinus TaxID=2017483 RepID=A0A220U326_9BACI|nr:sigma 54-interacting transcriptional regulator [Virgibacillus phasianinus]ASK62326.1 transcriptional regulator [Virgibacillus phasianinus]
MNTYGSIMVVSYQKHTLKTIIEQLQEIRLNEYFEIHARTVDELFHSTIEDDTLVLLTSKILLQMVKPYFPKDTPFIIAKRMLNFPKVRKVLEIPKGSKVLLVSDMKEAAEETISIVKETGIHLNFQSYYPGAKLDTEVKIAITPGDAHLVPDTVDETIDIGSRFIDISSIIEVFNHFKVSDFELNRLSARYIQSLVHLTEELSQEIFTAKSLRNSLEQIVNNIDDAILLFTNDGVINMINQKATHLLKRQGLDMIGKEIQTVVPSAFIKGIQSIKNDDDTFKDIDGIAYYIRKKNIYVDSEVFGTLLMFRRTNEIQQIEYNYRNKIKGKNFVAQYTFNDMVTVNQTILESIKIAKKLAKSDSTILILGETGTGKEILAQAIHNESLRSYHPFVGANFAALSETLLESELFGYEGGSFTGAKKDGRSGLFEQAHKGTIFLDEIGDASPTIQNRLLRVLQERQILRVGGEQIISLDLRIIAATNKNLEELIESGDFREDLFYRLNVLPIWLPPLRNRVDDIELLSDIFIKKFSRDLGRTSFTFSKGALEALKSYHWPGNIRELQNTIEYLAHICEDTVYKEQLPFLMNSRFINIEEQKQRNYDAIIESFQERGFIDELVTMLKFLSKNAVSSSGRHRMLNFLRDSGYNLSDQQVRYRQELLRNAGLIIVSRGRKGSEITSEGNGLLEYLAENG